MFQGFLTESLQLPLPSIDIVEVLVCIAGLADGVTIVMLIDDVNKGDTSIFMVVGHTRYMSF